MTQPKPAQKILRQAFGSLTDVQLGRLKWHVERGTTILCGRKLWKEYVDGKGAG